MLGSALRRSIIENSGMKCAKLWQKNDLRIGIELFIWDLEELKPVYLGGSLLYLPPTELESALEHT